MLKITNTRNEAGCMSHKIASYIRTASLETVAIVPRLEDWR
jgi:hypothetical protein